MKCCNCHAEWNVNPEIADKMTVCPFCGKPLAEEKNAPQTMEAVLREILKSEGADALLNGKRMQGYFADLAPDMKRERAILRSFVACDGPAYFEQMRNASEREQRIQFRQFVDRMYDEYAVAEKDAEYVCNAFRSVISSVPASAPASAQAASGNDEEIHDFITATNRYALGQISKERYVEITNRLREAMLLTNEALHYKLKGNADKAFQAYRTAAELGAKDAFLDLGICYEEGTGTAQNMSAAFSWYRKAAECGVAEGEFRLGQCYEFGRGIEQDFAEAAKWYQKAADLGHADALAKIGSFQRQTGDSHGGFKSLLKAAEASFAYDAWYALGECYEEGNGTERDAAKAMEWYRKAADGYHIHAKARIGIMLYNQGAYSEAYTQLDDALDWIDAAGEYDTDVIVENDKVLAEVYYIMGCCKETGTGTPKNETRAREMYQKAAQLGHKEAQQKMNAILERDRQQKEVHQKKLREFYKAAEEDGNADAMCRIGMIHEFGDPDADIPVNIAEAMRWYQKAADSGHPAGAALLNRLKNKGQR